MVVERKLVGDHEVEHHAHGKHVHFGRSAILNDFFRFKVLRSEKAWGPALRVKIVVFHIGSKAKINNLNVLRYHFSIIFQGIVVVIALLNWVHVNVVLLLDFLFEIQINFLFKEHIVGLEVSVHDPVALEVLQTLQNSSQDTSDDIFGKYLVLSMDDWSSETQVHY